MGLDALGSKSSTNGDPQATVVADAAPPRLVPFSDFVVIIPDEAPEFTPGGLIAIPESVRAAAKPKRGAVLAVGPGRLKDNGDRLPVETQVGDHVLYGPYAGTDVEADGATLKVCRDTEIYARFVRSDPVPPDDVVGLPLLTRHDAGA